MLGGLRRSAPGDEAAGFGVIGCGVTGRVVVDRLLASGASIAAADLRAGQRNAVGTLAGVRTMTPNEVLDSCPCVVLCQPGSHAAALERAVAGGSPKLIVTLTDQLDAVEELFAFDDAARDAGLTVLVGAGMAPGLSSLLARSLAEYVAQPEEFHVAIHGTGGPACARQHHRALARPAPAWHDGRWLQRLGGSGRELCWFPEPIGAHDCYRAELADPRLLHHAFPGALRITARVSATRRDRLTARLPMLTPPHTGGNVGGVRVEVRGAGAHGERVTVIAGASGRVAEIAGRVAACAALAAPTLAIPAGVHGLADPLVDGKSLLAEVQRSGVTVQAFTGVPRPEDAELA